MPIPKCKTATNNRPRVSLYLSDVTCFTCSAASRAPAMPLVALQAVPQAVQRVVPLVAPAVVLRVLQAEPSPEAKVQGKREGREGKTTSVGPLLPYRKHSPLSSIV